MLLQEHYDICVYMCPLTHKCTLISGGSVSHRTAGSPWRKSVPETSVGGAKEPSLKRDGWMSCWKNRQKKWSNLGAWSTLQKALQSDTGVTITQGLRDSEEFVLNLVGALT